ncbi:MAG: hypothetical protein IJX44_01705 [Bacteroidaceae bacterium]|nr:hypothetical protein [Bacteroidaceae bacterium]
MKKILFLLAFLCSVSMFAQDVIVKKDGSTIVCRVIEFTESEIIYKKWSDLKGANYVMDKSLASAINYENGKKVNISEMSNLYMPQNQNTGEQQFNDKTLLALDLASQKKYSVSSIKKLRTGGWIGVGCIGIGTFFINLCANADTSESQVLYGAIGGGLLLGGIATSTYCFTAAHKRQKIAESLQQSSLLFQRDFKFEDDSSLSTSVIMINDRLAGDKTLGVGLSYNFNL